MKRNIMQNPAFQQMIGRMNDADGVFLCMTTLHKREGGAGVLNHEIMTDDFLLGDILRSCGSHEKLAIEHLKGDNRPGMIPVAQDMSRGLNASNTAPPHGPKIVRLNAPPAGGPVEIIAQQDVKVDEAAPSEEAKAKLKAAVEAEDAQQEVQQFADVMKNVATKEREAEQNEPTKPTEPVNEVPGAECSGVQPNENTPGS